jgi:hypothetical protein
MSENPRARLAQILADYEGFALDDDFAWVIEKLQEAWRMRYEIDTDLMQPSVARIYRDDALIWTGRDFSADVKR